MSLSENKFFEIEFRKLIHVGRKESIIFLFLNKEGEKWRKIKGNDKKERYHEMKIAKKSEEKTIIKNK